VPALVALPLVPILGVTFLMFMPVAGFLVLAQHLLAKVRGLFVREADPAGDPPASPRQADGKDHRAAQG
jgi:hypothetical protein